MDVIVSSRCLKHAQPGDDSFSMISEQTGVESEGDNSYEDAVSNPN